MALRALPSSPIRLVPALLFAALLVVPAFAADYVRTAETGVGLSRYTDGLGRGDGEFLRVGLVKEMDHRWLFETGRQRRFGETSWGIGVVHGRHVAAHTDLTAGVSTGTGDYLAPSYRFDLRVDHAVLPDRNLVLSAGYTRIDSKQENSSDGFGTGAVLWLAHWVLEAHYLHDIGHPGDALSRSWGLAGTWYLYKRTYLGAGISGGEVSYMLIGPDADRALVDYDADGWHVSLQQWVTSTAGFNLRYEHGSTDYYQVDGYTASVFFGF